MSTLRRWKTELDNLGLFPFFVYKIQNRRLDTSRKPLWYQSKYARFPLCCRPGTTDRFVFKQIYGEREYRCLDEIKHAGLIIDCGANVGYSSAYFLTRFPESHVISVEPDPGSFEALQVNLAPYGTRVKALKAAVWSRPVGLTFKESTRNGGAWGRQMREVTPGDLPEVEATDISGLLAGSGFERISILKIDVEGAEVELFASNYHDWITRVDCLVIELHGARPEAEFHRAISTEPFVLSRCDELTVCRRKPVTSPSQVSA
ncbi:MAG TPA: FkbM family methyltransferase [Chthoniobacterales bacterium]